MKAQEGHEGEVKAHEEQGEDVNSLHEESHVSNRHMIWWHNAWWVRVNNGPHLQTARDRRRVWRAATRAAQEVRETGKVPGGERGEMGAREDRKQHLARHFPLQPNSRSSNSRSNCSNSAPAVTQDVDALNKRPTRSERGRVLGGYLGQVRHRLSRRVPRRLGLPVGVHQRVPHDSQ